MKVFRKRFENYKRLKCYGRSWLFNYNYENTELKNHYIFNSNETGKAYCAGHSRVFRPETPTSVAGRAYTYDANGNMVSDGIKTLSWSNDNLLGTVVIGGQSVTMLYGPDSSRSKKSSNLGTTRYFGPRPIKGLNPRPTPVAISCG